MGVQAWAPSRASRASRRSRRLIALILVSLITISIIFGVRSAAHGTDKAVVKDSAHALNKKESGSKIEQKQSQVKLGSKDQDVDEDDDESNHEDEDEDGTENDSNQEDESGVSSYLNYGDQSTPGKPKQFDYRQIFSLTTRDRKYFSVYFGGGGVDAYNPNIIPHPTKHDLWIVVAQHLQTSEGLKTSEQLTCTAGFLNDALICAEPPSVLPISPSIPGSCEGDLSYFNFRNGPRDARMFYGPDAPYIIYGSQSGYTCLGLWLHDIRMLLDPFRLERYMLVKFFKHATEIHRPKPWKGIEKNYFLFWDSYGKAYAHYDLWPSRVFAQIDADGTVSGKDLAPAASESDQTCMARYMPTVDSKQESIHQASNTLHITMCQRADPGCRPNDNNTFIMHVFHHKSYYDFHGVYEPHVILFNRNSPFEIHAISQRPFWIHGREALSNETASTQYLDRDEWIPSDHTELFYVTSLSWRSHGQKHHGYIDDLLLISFGIEDTRSGAIDVTAGDILQDLAFC